VRTNGEKKPGKQNVVYTEILTPFGERSN